MHTLLPALALELTPGRDPRDYFFPVPEPDSLVEDVWLEIGFGGGEHLLWQADHHRTIGIIGAEPYRSGVAKLLSKLAPLSRTGGEHIRGNLRIYQDDAREIIAALPEASLGRVFLLFPDPWPKTRHHKRRFVQMAMLDELARVMKRGAEFRFATDDPGYLVWTLERLCAHSGFHWLARSPEDWRTRPDDWPQTRYEAKAIRAGRICTYLRFERR